MKRTALLSFAFFGLTFYSSVLAQEPEQNTCEDYAKCTAPTFVGVIFRFEDCEVSFDQTVLLDCLRRHQDDLTEEEKAELQVCAQRFPDCAVRANVAMYGKEPAEGYAAVSAESSQSQQSASSEVESSEDEETNGSAGQTVVDQKAEEELPVEGLAMESEAEALEVQESASSSLPPKKLLISMIAAFVLILTIGLFLILRDPK